MTRLSLVEFELGQLRLSPVTALTLAGAENPPSSIMPVLHAPLFGSSSRTPLSWPFLGSLCTCFGGRSIEEKTGHTRSLERGFANEKHQSHCEGCFLGTWPLNILKSIAQSNSSAASPSEASARLLLASNALHTRESQIWRIKTITTPHLPWPLNLYLHRPIRLTKHHSSMRPHASPLDDRLLSPS